MRLAAARDTPALLAFLRGHEAMSMFALINLLGQGAAMQVWMASDGRAITGLIGRTEAGMLLVQWPQGDWRAAARALAGSAVAGLLGPAEQITPLRHALGLSCVAARHDGQEPGFRLALDDLRLPDCAGWTLAPLTGAVADTVRAWRAAYEQEMFALPTPEATAKAADDVARWQVADSHRVLWHGAAPVALTGFNAALPEVVQVGAVYVPPALRGRGHARRAVGLHLAQARGHGVRRAVLFAASPASERTYRALGFQPTGPMGLVLFHSPQSVA